MGLTACSVQATGVMWTERGGDLRGLLLVQCKQPGLCGQKEVVICVAYCLFSASNRGNVDRKRW